MIAPTNITFDTITFEGELGHIEVGPLLFTAESFTRSNGTIAARIYERLTKASRRDRRQLWNLGVSYRQGVKDTLEALRTELS